VVSALDSRPGDQGSIRSSATWANSLQFATPLGEMFTCTCSCRPTRPFIPPGSINCSSLGWRLTSSVLMQGRRAGLIAAVRGCVGANPSLATVCTVPQFVITCSVPTSKGMLFFHAIQKSRSSIMGNASCPWIPRLTM
jgi:hypothetical protein